MKKIALLAVAVLAGCAQSSGVIKTGPSNYAITASASHGAGGMAAARKNAYESAAAECVKQGKQLAMDRESQAQPTMNSGMYTFDLAFRCE